MNKMKPQTPFFNKINFQTERLSIQSYEDKDYAQCVELYSDADLTKFFDHGRPRTPLEIDNYIDERSRLYQRQNLPFGLFSVFIKKCNSFAGQVDLVPTGVPGQLEIGWIFKKEFQNQGYCSEAVNSFLIPMVKELQEKNFQVFGKVINEIIATAHPENKPSQKVIKKAGLLFYKKGLRYAGNPRLWFKYQLNKPT